MEKCKVCNRTFKKVTDSHLKTHDISRADYNGIGDSGMKEVESEAQLIEEPIAVTEEVKPAKSRVDQVFDVERKYEDKPLSEFLKRYDITESDLTKIVLQYKTGKAIPVSQQIQHKMDTEAKEAEKLVGAKSLQITTVEKADILIHQHGYTCNEVKKVKGVKTWFLTK